MAEEGQINQSSGGFNLDFGLLVMVSVKTAIWAVLIFGLAIGGAYTYLYYTQPVFEAHSVIQLINENQANRILNVGDIYEDDNISKDIEIMRSPEFLKRVVSRLPLDVSYYTEGEVLTHEKYLNNEYKVDYEILDPIIYNKKIYITFESAKSGTIEFFVNGATQQFPFTAGDTLITPVAHILIQGRNNSDSISTVDFKSDDLKYFTLNSIGRLVQNLSSNYQVVLLNSAANTLRITVQHRNPNKASAICSAIGEEYIEYDQERQTESANSVIEFVNDQIDDVFQKLKTSEDLMTDFKQKTRLEQKQEIAGTYIDRMNKLEKNYTQVSLQITLLDQLLKSIQNEDTDVDIYGLVPILTGTEFESSITAQINELQRLVILRNRKLGSATASNPTMQVYQEQINLQKTLIEKSLDVLRERLLTEKEASRAKIKEIEDNFLDLPTREIEYARLERVFTSHEKYYTLLLEKKTEFSISKAGLVPENTILQRASNPKTPISPKPSLIYITSASTAIFLILALIALRYVMHKDVGVNDLKNLLAPEISILGIVPKSHDNIPQSQLVVDKKPKSIMAESFRSIRTNLEFFEAKDEKKVLAITSTISGEGKTFVAINLAGILAYSGKRVIILDLDMRRPRIHKGFDAQNDFGMSTFLSGRDDIKTVVQHSELDGLDFVTGGPIPPNPSELIINGKLSKLIEDLKEDYDIIMIDNPPVGLVADSITTMRMADYPIYIFRSEYSKKSFATNVNKVFRENKIKNLSVILNAVDIDSLKYKQYGSGYGAQYGYGYGYLYGSGGYYEEVKDKSKKSFLSSLKSKGGNS